MACLIVPCMGMPDIADSTIWINNPARKGTLHTTPPTYTVGQGLAGNGTTSYWKTGFNPVVDGGTKFTQNNNSAIWLVRSTRTTNADRGSGNYTTNGIGIIPRSLDTGKLYVANNGAWSIDARVVDVNNLYVQSRDNATTINSYINNVNAALTRNSSALLNREIFVGANNGTTVQYYSSDTYGAVGFGSALTQTDVNILMSAINTMLDSFKVLETLFSDTCDGTVIDTTKWQITNPDPTFITFFQNNQLTLRSLLNNGTTPYQNQISSKTGAITGVFIFSATSLSYAQIYDRFGLIIDTNNRIEFYHKLSGGYNLSYRVVVAGTTILEVDDVSKDFIQAKIVVDNLHNISAYKWLNDAWVQIGTTVNRNLGTKYIYMAARGYSFYDISMRDVKIINKNSNTLTP